MADFELPEAHKESFGALAGSMSFVGVCGLLFGVTELVFALFALHGGFVPVGVTLAVGAVAATLSGWWTTSAGRSLSALVRTRGRDLDHLAEFARQMRWLFGFQCVVVIVCALGIVATLGAFVWCTYLAKMGGACWGLGG